VCVTVRNADSLYSGFVVVEAMVTKDITNYALAYGAPAQLQGWVCECGVKLDFNESNEAACSKCGKIYQKEGENQISSREDD